MNFSLLPITIVPIKMLRQNDYLIQFSHSLIDYWNIDTSKSLVIQLGSHQIEATIERGAIRKDEIALSTNIFEELVLPIQDTRLVAQHSNKNNTLTLGPIIGLLTELRDTEEDPHFRSIHTFCQELHELVSNIGGFFYVFQLKDFLEEKLEGYYFQDERWRKAAVPLPDVIYNRIHSRRLEKSRFFQKLKADVNTKNIPVFNDQFLPKELVHQYLFSEDHMHPFLPDTIKATEQTLQDMLEKYKSVYIKPNHGSQGRNIIRSSWDGDKLLVEKSTGIGKDTPFFFENYSQFSKWITPYLEHRTYLVQQAIPLVNYKKRQLDFRILCHRNFTGSWKATSAVARISADKQFVSNIARGGELMKPIKILSLLSNRETAVQQLFLMKELAVEASSIISQNAAGLIGELGIDIGVDENRKLWIIEANAKPSKNFEEQSKKIRPSARALLEYFTFLSFSRRNE